MLKLRRAAASLLLLVVTTPIATGQDNSKPQPGRLTDQEKLETFKAQLLAKQLEALSVERKKVQDESYKRDSLILDAADDRAWSTRILFLMKSLKQARQAGDEWKKSIVPLETSDQGKVLARSDALVMAYIVQVERAAVPALHHLIAEGQRTLNKIDSIRIDNAAGGLKAVDDLIEKVRTATLACNAARIQIERYATEADAVLTVGESAGPLAKVSGLRIAADTLRNRHLQQGIQQLQSRNIPTEHLPQRDRARFSRVMRGELNGLYDTAKYLRSLPTTIEGRLGYSRPMLLEFTSRVGCEFRAKIHFFDRNGQYITSVWADGFCIDKRFRFDTVSWVKGPPKGAGFSLGYVYEGIVEAKRINGQYFYNDARKSSGDFSFDTTKAFVFPVKQDIAKAGDK